MSESIICPACNHYHRQLPPGSECRSTHGPGCLALCTELLHHKRLTHTLAFPSTVPHPAFNIIKAKRTTTCNLPSCNQKFKLGDFICCAGQNSWYHVKCGMEFKIQADMANDFEYLRTMVNMYALDEDMATLFNKRLNSREPSIYSGVPGSGKTTSLTAFVKLCGTAMTEVYVYNSGIAEYAHPLHHHPLLVRALPRLPTSISLPHSHARWPTAGPYR